MKISVIGTGYVGLVTGACLADVGNDVVCLDVEAEKVDKLRSGFIPIHEPGLDVLVKKNAEAGRLRFTTDVATASEHGDIQFIAVGTPAGSDGSADLDYVLAAARAIGRHMHRYVVVVDKSTVPVGTADRVQAVIAEELSVRCSTLGFDVVSNPEFLKEGAAIEDFMRPDRIVVGSDSVSATDLMRQLYAPFERNRAKLLVMDVRSAEMTKYAANAMLATRISFMNQLALLAESVGADIEAVRRGMGTDPRIGHQFLYAGCGYGGSCFPKDVRALIKTGEEYGRDLGILRAVEDANRIQKTLLGSRVIRRFGESLDGCNFAVWGLSFKPNTDDMREAPSIDLINELLRRGAGVLAFDPVASSAARSLFGHHPKYQPMTDATSALDGVDALILVTEWKEFLSPDFEVMKSRMRKPVIFDGRNVFDPVRVRALGFEYYGVGRK